MVLLPMAGSANVAEGQKKNAEVKVAKLPLLLLSTMTTKLAILEVGFATNATVD